MARNIYRVGADIYNAADNSRIGSTNWAQNWSGKSDVVDWGQQQSGFTVPQAPTNNIVPSNGTATIISPTKTGGTDTSSYFNNFWSTYNAGTQNNFQLQQNALAQMEQARQAQETSANADLTRYQTGLDNAMSSDLNPAMRAEEERIGYQARINEMNNIQSEMNQLQQDFIAGTRNIKSESRLEAMTKGRLGNLSDEYIEQGTVLNNRLSIVNNNLELMDKQLNRFYDELNNRRSNQIENYRILLGMANDKVISLNAEERDNIKMSMDLLQSKYDEDKKDAETKRNMLLDAAQNGVDYTRLGIKPSDTLDQIVAKLSPAYKTEQLRQEAISASRSRSNNQDTSYVGFEEEMQMAINAGATPAEAVLVAAAKAEELGIKYDQKQLQAWRDSANKYNTTYLEGNKAKSDALVSRTTKALLAPKKIKPYDYTNANNLANPSDFYSQLFGINL